MNLDNLDREIEIAIEAAKYSGDLLIDSKSQLNKEISSNPKDTKLKADVASENSIKEIIPVSYTHLTLPTSYAV